MQIDPKSIGLSEHDTTNYKYFLLDSGMNVLASANDWKTIKHEREEEGAGTIYKVITILQPEY